MNAFEAYTLEIVWRGEVDIPPIANLNLYMFSLDGGGQVIPGTIMNWLETFYDVKVK